jgi:D-sedoheptulose 7-phosphate isomerase
VTSHKFSSATIEEYFNDYSKALSEALSKIDPTAITWASRYMELARIGGQRVFVGGNGGSAAISQHLECDWQKGCHIEGAQPIKTHCLSSNVALITALGNDIGYEDVFSQQLEMQSPYPGELLVLISSSGKSPNIVKAAKVANEKKLVLIGLTGFDGGPLRDMADVSIHVPIHNYGIVEDAHQAVMHILAQHHQLKMAR